MTRTLAVLLAAGAGCLVGMQAPINSRLGKSVGSVQAATFSFLVGTLLLLAIAAFVHGGLANLGRLGRAPWWALVGGLLVAGEIPGATVIGELRPAAGPTRACSVPN